MLSKTSFDFRMLQFFFAGEEEDVFSSTSIRFFDVLMTSDNFFFIVCGVHCFSFFYSMYVCEFLTTLEQDE